jgi:AcrR family transcriptional regulator
MVRNSNRRSKKGSAGADRARSRTLARRLAILRAAGGAFRRHGVAQTGMREIAREASLSPANLYYYFRGKDELLAFCQDHALDRMLAEVSRARAQERRAPERLRRVIRAQVLCMLDDLAGAAAHLEVDSLPPRIRSRIQAKRDRYERAVRRIVEEGIRARTLTSPDPALATRAILGAVNWSARWYHPGGPRTPAEIAGQFADYLVRGLRRAANGSSGR